MVVETIVIQNSLKKYLVAFASFKTEKLYFWS